MRTRPLLIAAILLVALSGLTGCTSASDDEPGDPNASNPFAAKALYALPSPRLTAAAAQADADGDARAAEVLEDIAAVPTGIWLTPERYPAGSVGPFVSSVMAAADGRTLPLLVLYGLPDRDCTGGFSAGGLSASAYLPWVQEIADAASGAVVVLEPDALPSLVECGNRGQRIRLMSGAVDALVAAGVAVYLDAGHSDWVPASRIVTLLEAAGIDRVRGFSTNVSNYQPDGAELRFAEEVSDALGGSHYVIDTSRNGSTTGSEEAVSDWCNPPGRALGQRPGFVDDGTSLDAFLWVKPPAESDGTCHGGPTAGDVWIERAVALAEAAGW
ncbi:glycoside hydrolase family 6 protein [Nocardioides sp. R-C-SC26]|uniref:glycoside hydrolase family 6 protein n=1 Tax=Nocardioides sp. R-C-SC26 TaxID=2870414 RepID=UPI001E49EB26|nr:glycoside hydrolase family 6 protein [Nocardioides sp. R-C-SC26]